MKGLEVLPLGKGAGVGVGEGVPPDERILDSPCFRTSEGFMRERSVWSFLFLGAEFEIRDAARFGLSSGRIEG